MARIRIVYRNPFDYAALIASAEKKYFEATNLQLPGLSDVWTTGTEATSTLEADFGEVIDLTSVHVFHEDLLPGDVVTFQGHDGAGWVDVATLAYAPKVMAAYLAPFRSYQRTRLTIAKAGGAGTTRTLQKVFIGQYYEFEINPTRDPIDWTPDHLTKKDRTPSGTQHAQVGARVRGFECQIENVPDSMRQELEALDDIVGLHMPFVLVFNADAPNPERETIYGCLEEAIGFKGFTGPEGLRQTSISMREAR